MAPRPMIPLFNCAQSNPILTFRSLEINGRIQYAMQTTLLTLQSSNIQQKRQFLNESCIYIYICAFNLRLNEKKSLYHLCPSIVKYFVLLSNSDIMRLGYILLQSALHRIRITNASLLGRLIGSPRVPGVLTRVIKTRSILSRFSSLTKKWIMMIIITTIIIIIFE